MSDYAQVRKELEEKLRALTGRLSKITGDLRQERGPLNADFAEQAVELENEEVLEALDEAGRKEVNAIHLAIQRIENGTYGECEDCGATIKEGRLRAVPYASLCIKCAEAAEKH